MRWKNYYVTDSQTNVRVPSSQDDSTAKARSERQAPGSCLEIPCVKQPRVSYALRKEWGAFAEEIMMNRLTEGTLQWGIRATMPLPRRAIWRDSAEVSRFSAVTAR